MADEKKSLTVASHSNMTSAGVFRGSSVHLPRIFRGAGETDFCGLVAPRWPATPWPLSVLCAATRTMTHTHPFLPLTRVLSFESWACTGK